MKTNNAERKLPPSEVDKLRTIVSMMNTINQGKRKGNNEEEIALIEAWQDGIQEAGIDLVKRYLNIMAYIYQNPSKPPRMSRKGNISFSQNYQDKEDLFATILLNFFEMVDEYDPENGKFENFVHSTLHYRVYKEYFEVKFDELMNESNLADYETSLTTCDDSFIIEDSKTPSEHIELYQALNKLTKRQKQVIELLVMNGWNSTVVSEELKISSATVRRIKQEAIKSLKLIMKGDEEDGTM